MDRFQQQQREAVRWVRGRYVYDAELDSFAPSPDSTPKFYDPFEKRQATLPRRRTSGRVKPYAVLADALRLDVDDIDASLRFVNRWGILGLFLHDLPQQIYVLDESGWSYVGELEPDVYRPVVYEDSFSRRVQLFHPALSAGSDYQFAVAAGEDEHGNPDFHWDEAWPASIPWIEDHVAKHRAQFEAAYFPTLQQGPLPPIHRPNEPSLPGYGTPSDIWLHMHEPLQLFRWAMNSLQACAKAILFDRKMNEEIEFLFADGLAQCRIAPTFARGKATGRQWRYASLLAALYAMLLDRLEARDDYSWFACAACDKPFQADRLNQRYCDSTCRERAKKRRQRTRAGQSK